MRIVAAVFIFLLGVFASAVVNASFDTWWGLVFAIAGGWITGYLLGKEIY